MINVKFIQKINNQEVLFKISSEEAEVLKNGIYYIYNTKHNMVATLNEIDAEILSIIQEAICKDILEIFKNISKNKGC